MQLHDTLSNTRRELLPALAEDGGEGAVSSREAIGG